jgi:myo-inositol-1(or 4)-monophosphatase
VKQVLLEIALRAAHQAGAVLLKRRGEKHDVERKGYRDVVTSADWAAEEAVLAVIGARFPGHAILSEEAGAAAGPAPYTWVIDPLDGTTNYSRGHPTFSVSVAVLRDETPLVGVVHDPVRQQTFAAVRGDGATVNGAPIEVSRFDRLADSLVALDWAHADVDRAWVLERLRLLAPGCRTVRSLGSAALAMAYVGAGWVDVYFARGLQPWDTAAGHLIITEAGGEITRPDGGLWRLGDPALLATNGRVHEAVLEAWHRR